MRVLVTGGAGYIGSVVAERLVAQGDEVVVVDNLVTGHRRALHPNVQRFVLADIADGDALATVMREEGVQAVIHMAASSLVGVSVRDPAAYYRNNVTASLVLLDAMRTAGVDRIVFSSSAAVYGEPEKQPVEEGDATRPTSPYGETKLAFEHALHWYDRAYGIRHVSLRYFNAAGATERFGEDHAPETHLIPLLLRAAVGTGPEVTLFGEDYPTRDGTGIRDYVHVVDLADAHIAALRALDGHSRVYNLGCGGDGYSVREVVETCRAVTGRPIPVAVGPRRAGDPAVLVASSDRIRRDLGWAPRYQDLTRIVADAWAWVQARPNGYEDREG